MHTWLRRLRGAIGMGLTWAFGWAAFGILIGLGSKLLPGLPWHLFFDVFDAPLPALAIPGFFCGALFSVVLGVAGRHRRFDELSLPRFAGWGALGGLLVSLLPFLLGDTSGNPRSPFDVWLSFSGPLVVLGAASASVTLWIARKGEARGLPDGEEIPSLVGADDEPPRLKGGGN